MRRHRRRRPEPPRHPASARDERTTILVLDSNADALAVAQGWGADHTVLVDGNQVEQVKALTSGQGAHVVLDFVGEGGAQERGG